MQAPVGEGANRATHRSHLEAAARQGDLDAEAELAAHPDLPDETAHLWGYFISLHQTRPTNGFGPCRLPRSEIRAWQVDEGITLEPWETRAIVAIDGIWAQSLAKQQDKPNA